MKGAFLLLQQFELCEVRVLFTRVVNGQHGVCLCDGGDDVAGTLVGVWAQEYFNVAELVSDVFEFLIEGFAVVGKPVLDGFEQIPWEVCLIAFGVAVLCDVVESLGE